MNIQRSLMALGRFIGGHKTQILTVSASLGIVATAAIAFKESPEIHRIVEEKLKDLELTPKEDKETRKVIKKELVRKVAPRVLKIIASAAFTMRCVSSLNHEHKLNYAAAAGLAAINQKKFEDLKLATEQIVGPKKMEEIKTKIIEDQAKEEPKHSKADTFDGKGFKVYDPNSGFEFHIKDPIDLKDARAELQDDLNNLVSWVNVNDFYSRVLDEYVHFPFCERRGWNMGTKIDISWPIGADRDGHPCYVLQYDADLRRNLYGDLMRDDDEYY